MLPFDELSALFAADTAPLRLAPNLLSFLPEMTVASQAQTQEVFSDKWGEYDYQSESFVKMVANQTQWYLDLYGFADERNLAAHLAKCRVVLDAGSGTGYKAAWFAALSPKTVVIAADISDAVIRAAEQYRALPNLFFIQCDIGQMSFLRDHCFDYISCDQVIHHTTDPFATFQELVRTTAPGGELSVYVYRKKALPRELLDEHFRLYCRDLSHEERLDLSRQITELGRLLSTVEGDLAFPAIPALGIEGGSMSVQRFIYWNFLKCYWNEELGFHNSLMTNYDWYAPSQAFRYSEEEFRGWIEAEGLDSLHFHREEACYSGRFMKPLTHPSAAR